MQLITERNIAIFAASTFGIFSIGVFCTTILPQFVDHELMVPKPHMKPYTEQELRGRAVYLAEGCVYCHTQQIRHLKSDQKRYGWRLVDAPPSKGWEYAYDNPHFIGTKRTGPDLARVGGKYASEWHWSHFKNPRDLGEKYRHTSDSKLQQASIMPSYTYLGDEKIKDLTAYIQTLGRNVNWRKTQDGQLLNDYEE
jgi:cytochrome c oxidase cbb3-type subunit 2